MPVAFEASPIFMLWLRLNPATPAWILLSTLLSWEGQEVFRNRPDRFIRTGTDPQRGGGPDAALGRGGVRTGCGSRTMRSSTSRPSMSGKIKRSSVAVHRICESRPSSEAWAGEGATDITMGLPGQLWCDESPSPASKGGRVKIWGHGRDAPAEIIAAADPVTRGVALTLPRRAIGRRRMLPVIPATLDKRRPVQAPAGGDLSRRSLARGRRLVAPLTPAL